MEKIYIAGCGGMLGEAFYECFKVGYDLKCTDIDVNDSWLSYCDIRDLEAYRKDVVEFAPDYLFHLGAYTDLEYCELHQDECYRTNTMAVENASYIANLLNVPLLYISTAGIFDGAQNTYDDWDTPNPMGYYAKSKYEGEKFVVQNVQKHLVCRAGWMMGGGPDKDKKFIQKIMSQLKQGNKTLNVVNDKDGTPTYTHDFAENVKTLLESRCWGLYNMVCSGFTSRLEVARELIQVLGLAEEITINEVDSGFFSEEYFADRPPSERLINRKLRLRNMDTMQDWKIALRSYISRDYKNYLD